MEKSIFAASIAVLLFYFAVVALLRFVHNVHRDVRHLH